jgi:two-component system sensor histidine kinase QseC
MAKLKTQQKITACLWFDKNAEDAVKFYKTIFKNSKIISVSYYTENSPMPEGTVLTIRFSILGQEFLALNAGPQFKFTEAVSFVINCDTQKEIDYYWEKLSKGGEKSVCGWLKDKFGLSWQVAPTIVEELIADKNKEKASRVMQAILKMKKMEIKKLQKAYKGK